MNDVIQCNRCRKEVPDSWKRVEWPDEILCLECDEEREWEEHKRHMWAQMPMRDKLGVYVWRVRCFLKGIFWPFPIKYFSTGGFCHKIKRNEDFRVGPWVGNAWIVTDKWILMRWVSDSRKYEGEVR